MHLKHLKYFSHNLFSKGKDLSVFPVVYWKWTILATSGQFLLYTLCCPQQTTSAPESAGSPPPELFMLWFLHTTPLLMMWVVA